MQRYINNSMNNIYKSVLGLCSILSQAMALPATPTPGRLHSLTSHSHFSSPMASLSDKRWTHCSAYIENVTHLKYLTFICLVFNTPFSLFFFFQSRHHMFSCISHVNPLTTHFISFLPCHPSTSLITQSFSVSTATLSPSYSIGRQSAYTCIVSSRPNVSVDKCMQVQYIQTTSSTSTLVRSIQSYIVTHLIFQHWML